VLKQFSILYLYFLQELDWGWADFGMSRAISELWSTAQSSYLFNIVTEFDHLLGNGSVNTPEKPE
jgi:hypothetical protein